nr:MAG TPA: hypothetical protein [Bacteriophage sp.]
MRCVCGIVDWRCPQTCRIFLLNSIFIFDSTLNSKIGIN